MIKLLVPYMPTACDLLPYFERIDSAMWYSNNGPLVRELEAKLSTMMGTQVVTVANGTLAIELALHALGLPPGTEVLVPSVTFLASARAIMRAGMIPVICDVDPASWMLTPQIANAMHHIPPVVMPVAAFGASVQLEQWEQFAAEHGCHVVIDAAGALPAQKGSASNKRVTVVCSLHATKSIGAGEGGLIASCDADLIEHVRRMCNFGFGAEIAHDGSTNAKLSEYHAAVGLASMDPQRLDYRQEKCLSLSDEYLRHLPISLQFQNTSACEGGRTLFPVLLPDHIFASGIAIVMASHEIETRQWYAPFLHQLTAFAPYVGSSMRNADMLSERMIGLPFHCHMTVSDVVTICGVLKDLIE